MNDAEFLGLDITDLARAMREGRLTAVELCVLCLNRICVYDRRGPALNAVAVLNPALFEEAAKLDAEARAGRIRGPMHGIPLVVKDSFKAAGLTVAAGSPAFADLIASEDAAAVARLREAGAIVIGKTNMPPMAIGGGQRSLYGKTSSPYNPDYLAAAWHSGSSIGSGVAVAAGFAPIALAEETVSSGRSPASNNGLVAYTPSRGVVSIRGNWPLFALRDVVVPYARSLADLALTIREIIRPDPETQGDLWRDQTFIAIPGASAAWPRNPDEALQTGGLRGKRLGIPKMYVGRDKGAHRSIPLRPSIRRLWERAEAELASLGAEIVDVDYPVVSRYEGDREGAGTLASNGYVPTSWDAIEIGDLVSSCWKQFLRLNGDPGETRLPSTPPNMIHPDPPDAVDTRRRFSAHEGHDEFRYDRIVEYARGSMGRPLEEFPQLAEIMRGLERARRELFEDWMTRERLDFVAFPANCDISRADAETGQASSDQAWTNGAVFSNMNHVMRHLGIPSVSVPMGIMEDTGMPVNLTVCGPGWSDFDLLRAAYDYEQASRPRLAAAGTPSLSYDPRFFPRRSHSGSGPIEIDIEAKARLNGDGSATITGRAEATAGKAPAALSLFIDGSPYDAGVGELKIESRLTRTQRGRQFRSLLCVLAYGGNGEVSARHLEVIYE
jgi:amidase